MNNDKLKEAKITQVLLDFAMLIMKRADNINSPSDLETLVRTRAKTLRLELERIED